MNSKLDNRLYELTYYYDKLANFKDLILDDIDEQAEFIIRHVTLHETMDSIPMNTQYLMKLKIDEYEFCIR